jgi:hypothetical protein
VTVSNHPREALGLLGDDRQAPIRVLFLELLGERPDAGQRGLEVVAHPAQEVVFRGIELDQAGVLIGHALEQLGIPDGDADLGTEQLEQALVGGLPGPGRRQVTDDQAQPLLAGPQLGPDRAGIARDHLLVLDRGRVDQQDQGIDHAEGSPGVGRGPPDEVLDPISGRRMLDRREDPAELPIAPLEGAGQAIVALGQARQLVVAADGDRGRQVAGRDPVDRCRDRPQGRGQVGRQEVGHEDRDQGDQGHEQEEQAGHR